eukprot:CAMPEP_0174901420 /NCGR_PEP_ID=MMETSP0167-20121228/34454_1 /TAXON_ID=38298 /ORGANISM="Rhodella maculata, Strain CCMP736" /LENGTH=55 /DNA_ID=CAMNT_0016143093 /DNA_START=208 /DNA_END=375 /DNA_ORIENTATION=-
MRFIPRLFDAKDAGARLSTTRMEPMDVEEVTGAARTKLSVATIADITKKEKKRIL